jgi:hypothetical protein
MNLAFAGCEIDLDRQELRRAGEIVHVEPQVYDLLIHLLPNRHRVVSKAAKESTPAFHPVQKSPSAVAPKSWLINLGFQVDGDRI